MSISLTLNNRLSPEFDAFIRREDEGRQNHVAAKGIVAHAKAWTGSLEVDDDDIRAINKLIDEIGCVRIYTILDLAHDTYGLSDKMYEYMKNTIIAEAQKRVLR